MESAFIRCWQDAWVRCQRVLQLPCKVWEKVFLFFKRRIRPKGSHTLSESGDVRSQGQRMWCDSCTDLNTARQKQQSQPSPQSNTNPTGYSDKCFHLQLSSGDSERRRHTVWTCCSKECGSRYKLHRSSPRRLTCILFSFWSRPLNRDNGGKGWAPATDKHALKQWRTHKERVKRGSSSSLSSIIWFVLCPSPPTTLSSVVWCRLRLLHIINISTSSSSPPASPLRAARQRTFLSLLTNVHPAPSAVGLFFKGPQYLQWKAWITG